MSDIVDRPLSLPPVRTGTGHGHHGASSNGASSNGASSNGASSNGASSNGALKGGSAQQAHQGHDRKRLGAFLCWAVVFADIGTSVYYTPGILFGQVGHLAGLFVTLTLIVFLLLTLKYAEATVRFPEGGGEVTVASRGLNPWAGALGGTFILIDYFLTAAISSLSGLHYFSVVMPTLAPYVLPITLVVILALGVLNWWGVQESATVSAVIATTAFVSDLVILLVIFARVPLADILRIFREIFSGSALTGVTILTGYAGAFLAFSGLESIAQLAPVMRVPRRKVVSLALTVVSLTVGFTSPLLTIFSTILLTDPRFRGTMISPSYAAHVQPAQFISLLAGAYGGVVLAVAVAVTAAALLIFASNTAIIGAYHVVLALARLRYFPRIVRRSDPWRQSPIVAIALVTLIPMGVLVAVGGNIDLLGELYGFGLLGAFSLMCISMDRIRWLERRGGEHIGALVDPELSHEQQRLAPTSTWSNGHNGHNGHNGTGSANGHALAQGMRRDSSATCEEAAIHQRLSEHASQLGGRGVQVWPGGAEWHGELATWLRDRADHLGALWTAIWPHVKFYLGLLTTVLVLIAWLTNLVGKPLATTFGGGLTCLGLAVAILHYRYQAAHYPVVFLDLPAPVPHANLVVLSPITNHSKAVIQDAIMQAKEYPPVFLYLAPPTHEPTPRILEIRDRFGMDEEAQLTLSRAKRACNEAGVQGKYLYAVGGAPQVCDIAARVRPREIVAEEQTARRITHAQPGEIGAALSPEHVRYRQVNGTTVAHYVLHAIYARSRDHQ